MMSKNNDDPDSPEDDVDDNGRKRERNDNDIGDDKRT